MGKPKKWEKPKKGAGSWRSGDGDFERTVQGPNRYAFLETRIEKGEDSMKEGCRRARKIESKRTVLCQREEVRLRIGCIGRGYSLGKVSKRSSSFFIRIRGIGGNTSSKF